MAIIPIVGRQRTRRVFSAAVCAAACLCLAGHACQAPAQNTAEAVRLTIDYGDGVQKIFTALPWKEKMTVFDALQAAEKRPRGIKLAYLGRRETIFITAIDELANEGANGRNWRYTMNDEPAQKSAGVMELKAGDAIVWRFVK